MRKYFRIYKQIIALNISRLLIYRTDAVMSSLIAIAWGGFGILVMVILTSKVSSIFGWTANQLVLLSAVYNVVIGIFHMLLSGNFSQMSRMIHYGELDGVLLKPIDSQFFLSVRFIHFPILIRALTGVLFILWFSTKHGITFPFYSIVLSILFGTVGIVLVYSIWFIVTTLMIWFSNLSNLIDLIGMSTGMAKYPREIVRNVWVGFAFALVPIMIAINVPTKAILGKLTLMDASEMLIIASSLLLFSHLFWRFALRYYSSASG